MFSAVAVAKMTMSDAEMVDNIRLAMDRVKECIPGGKENIRSFHVGIKGRVMLPIYLCSAGNHIVVIYLYTCIFVICHDKLHFVLSE